MKIIKFDWDNAKGEEYNGKSLLVGQYLPKTQNASFSHVNIYGISLSMIDSSKDKELKNFTCYAENTVGQIGETTKEEARKALIHEIDKALDVLFDPKKMFEVNRDLNIEKPEEEESF